MKAVGLYENLWLHTNLRIRLPNQRDIRSFFSRQHFRHKEEEEGFPKGGTLVHLFGSVPKARTAETVGSEKNKPDTQ